MSNSKENSKSQAAICIAGAHRSGTSMVTRLLHQCGLDLGPESDLMPAQADNPDGFWEHLRFVGLNDEILNSLGGAWDLPPKLDENFADKRLDPLREKARALVHQFDETKIWGWKDPRNSLTWPFWKDVLPSLKTLIVVRNPLEVASSMRKRNGTSYAFGLRLWEIYNRRLLNATNTTERLITRYDAFFENPESELARIARFIGLSDKRAKDAAALVTRNRRHTHFTIEELVEARVSPELLELFRELSAEAGHAEKASPRSRDRSVASATSPEIIPGATSRLDISVPDNEPIRRELAELRGAKIELQREVSALQGEVGRQRKEVLNREDRIRELRGHMGRLDHEIALVRERFTQTNEMLRQKSIELAEAETRAGELGINLRRQLHLTKRLLRLADDFKNATARLRTSRRWKMANPLAALRALFTGKGLAGYGHLEKTVSQYDQWRAAHPELAEIDNAIHEQTSPVNQKQTKNPVAAVDPPAPLKPIAFAIHENPDVSIIIPVHNQVRFTHACLASLQEHVEHESFEVIVVDDGSNDETGQIIANIPGVVYLANEQNIGFIASCNRGAKEARGKYLFFLNNDTEVTPGWLYSLRATFAFEPRAGIVGSKLVYPDGRLQEAGGIIWRDGSGWNRGKFGDAQKPEYNFLREMDYCSGAALMIPKSLFESLGGFDCKYTPAYYEDTDLAFKVRRHGYKTLYQPLSQVIHYEGATGGTDISAGAKKYQEINRATFIESWTDELAKKPVNGDVASFEQLKPGQKRILIIDHHLPMPDRDSGSVRMSNILRILYRLGHRVTFLPDNLADIAPYGDEVRQRGIEFVHYPYARSISDYLSNHGTKFDVVILSRCDVATQHVDNVRLHAPQSRLIFDTVDLHFVREHREAEITRDQAIRQAAREREEREYSLIDKADETWVVSECEKKVIADQRPQSVIEVVSNIVDAPGSSTPFSLRRDLLFIGGFQHTPNVDAVIFFVREIFPGVRERLPAARFYIIGDKAPPSITELASEHIIVTGLQPDVRPYFDSVKLSVAPLRWGAGVKGKINQSMGLGVPVVASSIAVEGMNLTNGSDILIADAPHDFARAVIDVYESEDLWERISKNGIEKTKADYSIETATKQLSRLLSDEHIHHAAALQFPDRTKSSKANDVATTIHQEAMR
jgi:GT2 family glycosyltransferase/glycosyltransferase involved in cell wall biosynthesis